MLNTLKQTGVQIGRDINQAWDRLAEGWRQLLSRSSHALTEFRQPGELRASDQARDAFPSWGLLVGELEETARDVVLRLELPGLDRSDCAVTIEDNVLRVSGEKRLERDTDGSTYHVMERAYGAFERVFALPRNVLPEQAQASFRNGVLTVRLPKAGGERSRLIKVS